MEQKKVWFVTTYAELSFTMRAEDYQIGAGGKEVKVRPHRICFMKEIRPRALRGHGMLSAQDPGATDKNIGPYWGVYSTSDPAEIEYLRNTAYYKQTEQNNSILGDRKPKLKELSFNPSEMAKEDPGLVRVGANSTAAPKIEEPVESVPSKPKARVGVTKS